MCLFCPCVYFFGELMDIKETFFVFRQNLSSSLFKMGQNHYLLRKSLHYKQVSKLKFDKRYILIFSNLQVLLMTHLSAIAISLYFYWRHNAYCEPGIYSGTGN